MRDPEPKVGPTDLPVDGATGDPVGAAIRSTRMPIVVSDATLPDNPLVFVNDAFLRLTGYERDEVIGRNCRFLQGPETDAAAVERIRTAVRDGADLSIELLNYRKDGAPFWNALNISPVRTAAGRVRYFFGSQFDISARRTAEAELRTIREDLESAVERRTRDLQASLDQQTLLLHEIDHRVKNNLQLISSLMLLQSRRTDDPAVADALQRMQQRLNALSTVHRRLFQADDASRFDLAVFIADLTVDLAASSPAVKLELDLRPVDTPAGQAAPIALLLSEIIGNALRHAYPDPAGGSVRVSLRPTGAGCRIEVVDDGVGFGGRPPGFGMTIVNLLARQLNASVAVEAEAGRGVTVRIDLPIAPAG